MSVISGPHPPSDPRTSLSGERFNAWQCDRIFGKLFATIEKSPRLLHDNRNSFGKQKLCPASSKFAESTLQLQPLPCLMASNISDRSGQHGDAGEDIAEDPLQSILRDIAELRVHCKESARSIKELGILNSKLQGSLDGPQVETFGKRRRCSSFELASASETVNSPATSPLLDRDDDAFLRKSWTRLELANSVEPDVGDSTMFHGCQQTVPKLATKGMLREGLYTASDPSSITVQGEQAASVHRQTATKLLRTLQYARKERQQLLKQMHVNAMEIESLQKIHAELMTQLSRLRGRYVKHRSILESTM